MSKNGNEEKWLDEFDDNSIEGCCLNTYLLACKKRQAEIDELKNKLIAPLKCTNCGNESMWAEDIDYREQNKKMRECLEWLHENMWDTQKESCELKIEAVLKELGNG